MYSWNDGTTVYTLKKNKKKREIEIHSAQNNKSDKYSRKFKFEPDKKKVNLYMLIGLPGAGKDTFLNKLVQSDSPFTYLNDKKHFTMWTVKPENAVVLCRDDIRAELGYCEKGEKIVGTTKQEETVTAKFNERLLNAARNGKDIIINNINLKSKYREQITRYLSGYDLNVRYVYLEAGSGADKQVSPEMIAYTKAATDIMLIVGGGIRDAKGAYIAAKAGADLIVTGTVVEESDNVKEKISEIISGIRKASSE